MNESIWEKVYTSALKFLVPLDIQETYMAIANEAVKLVGGGFASIYLLEEDDLKRVYSTHPELEKIHPRKKGVTYDVLYNGVPQLRQKNELIKANKHFKSLPFESNISLPLVYGHVTLGVLSIVSPKGKKFTSDDLQILSLFTPPATLAIRKATLTQELQQALEVRNLFISLADHELRNPLTTLGLYGKELLKVVTGTKQKKYALKINTETNRIRHLVNEFLNKKNGNGDLHYNFQEVNLIQLIQTTLARYKDVHKSHQFIFTNPTIDKLAVTIDPEKIMEVLINILNNSTKFSPPPSLITISLKKTIRQVIVSIADKGTGISQEDIESVFEKSFKGTSKKQGMGLGLYLSKQIIDAHLGTISIKSKEGKGTTVSITLPLANTSPYYK